VRGLASQTPPRQRCRARSTFPGLTGYPSVLQAMRAGSSQEQSSRCAGPSRGSAQSTSASSHRPPAPHVQTNTVSVLAGDEPVREKARQILRDNSNAVVQSTPIWTRCPPLFAFAPSPVCPGGCCPRRSAWRGEQIDEIARLVRSTMMVALLQNANQRAASALEGGMIIECIFQERGVTGPFRDAARGLACALHGPRCLDSASRLSEGRQLICHTCFFAVKWPGRYRGSAELRSFSSSVRKRVNRRCVGSAVPRTLESFADFEFLLWR